jgi:arylsulfatase A-like enzyme
LTSLHPLEHGAGGRVPDFTGLDPNVATLPEVLRARGVQSHAIVNVTFLAPETFGVTRGFDAVDHVSSDDNVELRAAATTTSAALEWLDLVRDHGRPFLLLVHYFDPHAVYAPPRHYREVWAAAPDKQSAWTFGTRAEMTALRAGRLDLSRDVIARAERLYVGVIAYLDA